MKVIIKLEVSDEMRRAIRNRRGKSGMATRADVKALAFGLIDSALGKALVDYRNDPDQRKKAARKLHALGPALHNDTWPKVKG